MMSIRDEVGPVAMAVVSGILIVIIVGATLMTNYYADQKAASPLDSVTVCSTSDIYEIIDEPREIGDATNLAAIAVNQLDKGVKTGVAIAMLAPSGKFKKGDRVTATRIQYAERVAFNMAYLYFARDSAPERTEK